MIKFDTRNIQKIDYIQTAKTVDKTPDALPTVKTKYSSINWVPANI